MKFMLTAEINNETGDLGWKDSRIRSDAFGPLTYPIGLAHDCLEHAAFDGVADEIEAHGALYRVRVEGGYCTEHGSNFPPQNLAYEWENLFQGLVQDEYLPDPPKTRPLDSHIEDDISEIISRGRQTVLNVLIENYPENGQKFLDRLCEVFRAYFRRGYRKAGQRFKGMRADEMSHMFGELVKLFERKRIEFEGERIEVLVNVSQKTVQIREFPYEEY